ncbi:prepilin-type N-terminal cleavage/methylation domain-containing protein [Candidatus Gracilibacteria bacterium]|nr:prepilin-type N-terminal cleavage/methylation domain-containing protein [Candidatus Gracilibacteria bacterium]
MKKTKKAFSLIEIIISTIILTIGVFGVYKLIGNNVNLISSNDNYKTFNDLYPNFKECITSLKSSLSGSYNSGSSFSINFGNDNMSCLIGNYNSNFDFTPVLLNNNEYYLFGEVTKKESDEMELKLNIYNSLNGYMFNSGSLDNYMILK